MSILHTWSCCLLTKPNQLNTVCQCVLYLDKRERERVRAWENDCLNLNFRKQIDQGKCSYFLVSCALNNESNICTSCIKFLLTNRPFTSWESRDERVISPTSGLVSARWQFSSWNSVLGVKMKGSQFFAIIIGTLCEAEQKTIPREFFQLKLLNLDQKETLFGKKRAHFLWIHFLAKGAKSLLPDGAAPFVPRALVWAALEDSDMCKPVTS